MKFSGYCFYLNTKVKQVNNVTADLPSDMITILLWFYICYCCNFIFFCHFGLCSRTKLRLRDSTFDMQLIPHVWDSWIKCSPFFCSKTSFVKLCKKKITTFALFILLETKIKKLKWGKVFNSGLSKFFNGCLPQNIIGPLSNTLL